MTVLTSQPRNSTGRSARSQSAMIASWTASSACSGQRRIRCATRRSIETCGSTAAAIVDSSREPNGTPGRRTAGRDSIGVGRETAFSQQSRSSLDRAEKALVRGAERHQNVDRAQRQQGASDFSVSPERHRRGSERVDSQRRRAARSRGARSLTSEIRRRSGEERGAKAGRVSARAAPREARARRRRRARNPSPRTGTRRGRPLGPRLGD